MFLCDEHYLIKVNNVVAKSENQQSCHLCDQLSSAIEKNWAFREYKI